MKCPVCGNEVNTELNFCGGCGTSISDLKKNLPSETEETTFSNEDVLQENNDRLFLDDEEEGNPDDDAIINQFFNNLDLLEDEDDMQLSNEYNPEMVTEKKIAPVLEEIPEEIPEPVVEEVEEKTVNPDSIDNYMDIVAGGTLSSIKPKQEPIPETPLTNEVEDTSPIIPQNTEVIPNETVNDVSHTDEPQILIDNRRESEQIEFNKGDFSVDVNEINQTPYLDSFVAKPNINVDFDTVPEKEISDVTETKETEENTIPKQEENIENDNISPVPSQPFVSAPSLPNNPDTTMSEPQNPNPQNFIPQPANPFAQPINNQNDTQTTQSTQKPKKKKKTGLIIGIVLAVLLVITIVITFLVGGKIKDALKDNPLIPTNPQENVTESTTYPLEDDSDYFEDFTEESIEDNTEPTTDNTEDTSNENTTTKPNWNLKTDSSIEAPLHVGDAASATRYLDDAKTFEDLNVSLTKIYRGSEALDLAQDYENRTNIKFKESSNDTEYVVIEYQVYIPEDVSTENTLANLPVSIRGASSNGVVYKDKSYVVSSWCIEDGGATSSGKLVTCREIFQLPVNCTDYYIVFGVANQTNAIFKGE